MLTDMRMRELVAEAEAHARREADAGGMTPHISLCGCVRHRGERAGRGLHLGRALDR